MRVGLRELLGDGFDDHFNSILLRQVVVVQIPPTELDGGRPVEFEFEVPASFEVSFQSTDRRRFHEVFAALDGTLLGALRPTEALCPVQVLPASVAISRRGVARTIGATRQEQQFAEVARALGATARGRQLSRAHGPVRVLISSRVVDGACIFLNRPGFPGGAGCALHLAAVDAGEPPLDWKPSVCWQLPVRVDWAPTDDGRETATVRGWTRADWGDEGETMAWCCTEGERAYVGDRPVVESLAEELTALVGEEVYVELRRRMR